MIEQDINKAQENAYNNIKLVSKQIEHLSRYLQTDFSLINKDITSDTLRNEMRTFNNDYELILDRLNKAINRSNNIFSYYIDKLEELEYDI